MQNEKCFNCKKNLSFNEIGLHKKLINRGSRKFMCITCLAQYLELSESVLEEKIVQFKESGCILFE